ncbi:MAG: tRNA uridine-5-carboxymethylaminomethyl(34) synthesis GTPase MnmE [Candidatus Omnitrophica bacterium]|nr:tRNA uridine-5-carboxymethylaminomethyl(34) synthesis GTPase MnmE [Candidatus Omnitrophota bacterium]
MGKVKNDTIAAISTPPGEGGIGIVRMSGPEAIEIAARIFRPKRGLDIKAVPSHTVHFGHIVRPGERETVDEVLLAVMRAPATYTTEDIAEINCHGGPVTVKRVLELCLAQGARLAGHGEFTKRAFLSGRMDLVQAEAVLDVIRAESDEAQRLAMRDLRGVFSGEIKRLRDEALDILSLVELGIDFTGEDVEFEGAGNIAGRLRSLKANAASLLGTFRQGEILTRGLTVVIAGRPNVGKSSLMNALLKKDRVIVTPVSGTTRDVVEESVDINGIKVKLTDTAGIRETDCRIETESIRRALLVIARADLVIFMLDASMSLSPADKEIYQLIGDKERIVILNKVDLEKKVSADEIAGTLGGDPVIETSIVKGVNIEKIRAAVSDKVLKMGETSVTCGAMLSNIRHKRALESALENIENAVRSVSVEFNAELLASDINEAVNDLGLITGETVGEEVLDRIFAGFCIGK